MFFRKYKDDIKEREYLEKALLLVNIEVQKYHKLILYGAIMIIINCILLLPEPFFFGIAIDKILPQKKFILFLIAIISMLALKIITSTINYNIKMIFFKVNNKITIDIRKRLFEKINIIPIRKLEDYNTGYLMSRIQDDPPRLSALFGDQIINLIKQFIIFSISLIVMFFINWKLSLIAILQLPLFIYTVKHYGYKIKKQTDKVFKHVSILSNSLQENIEIIPLCKSFGKENYNVHRYIRTSFRALKQFIELRKLECTNVLVFSIIGSILPLTILSIGGYQIMYGEFTIGMLVTFISILSNTVSALCEIISFYPELKKINVALVRIGELLCLQEEPLNSAIVPYNINSISFKKVNFSYDKKLYDLEDINFTAKKGMRIGIVGHSGSGKTTLMKILCGLYDFEGEIFLNDIKIDCENRSILNKKVSIVPQESLLFNESVYKNLVIGNTYIERKTINNTLIKVGAWHFVDKLDNKIHTKIGERGNKLSVGEKQRLSIARALIKGSEILILDEATSNIDNISEKEILDSINDISKDIIVFLIVHKLENIKDCDNILVLNEGKLVESGTEEDLLKLNGYYTALVRKFK